MAVLHSCDVFWDKQLAQNKYDEACQFDIIQEMGYFEVVPEYLWKKSRNIMKAYQ